MSTEADTCRKYVLPKLYQAGWTDDQISQEKYFTDGRIVPVGKGHVRKPGKRVDYLLTYRPDFPIAVEELSYIGFLAILQGHLLWRPARR